MNSKLHFVLVLILGLGASQIFAAQEPDGDLGRQLYESIDSHDYAEAKRLIGEGADVNYRTPKIRNTPLIKAAYYGDDIELIRMLVDHHADVNAANRNRVTPLLKLADHALDVNFSAIADILLSAGADINSSDLCYGQTPLHFAVSVRSAHKVRYLLNHGADPEIEDSAGRKPIDHLDYNDIEMLRMLRSASDKRFIKND